MEVLLPLTPPHASRPPSLPHLCGAQEEIMQRVQEAVAEGRVETVVMTVGTQRRAVLEAIAYGCFLRDVESWVDSEYELLTPVGTAGSSGEA